ncbi:MAG: alpha/beta fold hydrolase [Anaerolineaceae bacterium]
MILESILKITSTLLISATVVGIGGPILGEMVSTAAPFFGKSANRAPAALSLNYESVSFQTSDGITLRGWFFPSDTPQSPAILYAPSTANDQRSGLSLVKPFHKAGYSVLLFSYRGYGQSDGDPLGFSYGARESLDVDAAASYLHNTQGAPAIGAIGHSAGAVAIVLSAARNLQINAVVAASPYTSVEEIWNTNRPKVMPTPVFDLVMQTSELRKGFDRSQVRPVDVIGQIAPRPILIMHGMKDRRITEEQVLALVSQAGEPKEMWWMGGLTHSEVRSIGIENNIGEIIQFFNRAMDSSQTFIPTSH